MDDQPDGCARTNGDRRLDLQAARRQLIASSGDILLGGLPEGRHEIASPGKAQGRAHAEERRDGDALEQRPGVEIDLVGQTRITGSISRRDIVDLERAAIGHDNPLPDNQCAMLAEGDDAVIRSDQPRALWNELDPACCADSINKCSARDTNTWHA